jgi:transcriptional regulator with XRE-family HTH domain
MTPILPVQCFLARTALGWSVTDLARATKVARSTVDQFERGDAVRATTIEKIQHALERAGVIWIDASDGGPSPRLHKG